MKLSRSTLLIAAGALVAVLLVVAGVLLGPLALQGPRVLSTTPADGERAANPRAQIRVELSQPVQPGSLGEIAFDPPVPLAATVEGNAVLIAPQAELSYNTPYRLTIAGLKNRLGRGMDAPLTISFSTVPYASVQQFGPADGAGDVALRGPVTVEFAAPVVTAEQVAAAAQDPRSADQLPQPLVLAPEAAPSEAVAGIGRWLSPTLFGFYPAADLHAATVYRATLREDVSSDGLARLERPVAWSFRTAAPLLTATRPFDGERDVAPAAAIEIQLANDVDVRSAGAAFLLRQAGGGPVPGTVEPFDGGFRFRPASPLTGGADYEAVLGAGVKSRTGAALNPQPLTWRFNVIGDPEVLQVEPLPDTTDVITTAHRISVRFNHPVVALTDVSGQAGLPNPLAIDPPLQGTGTWLDTSTYVFSATNGLEPSTTYRATVAAGLRDVTGGELRQPYSWSFSTIQPQVLDLMPLGEDVPPTSTIRLAFNQPMDPDDVRANVSLFNESTGEQVPRATTIRGSLVEIAPSAPLERGTSYRVVVPVDLKSANGRGGMPSPFVKVFRVAPLPGLAGSIPANGDQAADSSGSVQLQFTTEMDWRSVERNVTITPRPTEVFTSTYNAEMYLYLSLAPETDYQIVIGGQATDRFGVAIGEDITVSFRTAPLAPSLSLIGTSSRVGAYNAYVDARVPVQVVNIDDVSYWLARITPAEAAALASDFDTWRAFDPPAESIVRDDTFATPGERNRSRIALLELGRLEPGVYLLEVSRAGEVDRQVLSVSPYALTVKRSSGRLFVWAVDLASGKPVSNLELQAATFSYERKNTTSPRSLGRTGADGVLDAAFDAVDNYSTLYLWSPGDQPVSFLTTEWSSGIGPWDFSLPADYSGGGLAGALATDRPIYRPDQTVHVRGVLRVLEYGGQGARERYRTPSGEPATLTISDPEGNTVISRTVTLSEFGTFNVDLPIERAAPLGIYSLLASLDSQESTIYGSFTVAEYRKPTFEITVTPGAPDLTQGDTLDATAEARYFAGGALANAPVRWRVLAAPLFFAPETLSDYWFGDLDDADLWYRGEYGAGGTALVADGEGTTDAQGRFALKLPADLYGKAVDSQGNAQNAGGRTLTVEFEVTDVDGQVIAGQTIVEVHPASFYIGLRPSGYVVQAGAPQKVAITTVTQQGDPAPSRPLQVEISRREWYSVQERGQDGRLYWTSRYTDTLVQTIPATSDAQGLAEITFSPPSGGSYRVAASGKDDAGHIAKSSAFTWAYGGDVFWGVDDTNRLDLISDKRSYRPGETAKILVTAPYPGMTGLLTFERGQVLEHRLLTLSSTTEVIDVPISADYAPNVFVSLVLLKTPCDAQAAAAGPCTTVPDLRVGLANLAVSTEQQELNVSVTPDKPQAGPRDTVTYTIRATDSAGAGVRAELSLALVDKAVLSLADDPNPSLTNAFYARRGLGVQTSQTLTALVDRVTVKLQPGDKGGGGAEAANTVRTEFPDTAYWNAAVVTGADGTAQVTVALPDSLTTWRMTARAVTADTRVGQGVSDIIATRPLFVRPALPRFLTAGDAPALQAVVQNGTDAAIEAAVTLEVAGNQAAALVLDAPARQVVQVPSGGTALVRWPAKLSGSVAPEGALTLRLTVEGGGQRDAVEAVLPLKRFETPEVTASAGQVLDRAVETIAPPSGAGQLDLELAPSLAAGIYSGLDYLAAFPYECTEQTVSKFLPNAVTYRLFKQAGREDAQLRGELEQNLAVGVQRLAALQHLDGGWGWWENDDSNPYITAYVVQGLVEAQKAGLAVDQRMLNSGIDYLDRALNGAMLTLGAGNGVDDARAYALFVLAEAGKPDRARAVALFDQRQGLQIYGRAYLLMTLKAAGGEDARVKTLIGELMGRAVMTATDAHWQEQRPDYWTMSSDTRSTALALQALVRADPQNFLIPNATRFLMRLRDHGHWQTTQESAISAIALAEYVAASGELSADYRYSVALDGKALREGQVGRDNLSDPVRVALALADLNVPAGGQAQLAIEKQGSGRLYYTLRMRGYTDAAAVQALDRGFVISREYVAVAADTLTPTGRLVQSAALGEVVQVRLTIQVPSEAAFLTIEDMLPAGLEPLDASLKTVSSAAQDPELSEEGEQPGWWYFTSSAIRDDRVALFATSLPSGTYTYTYLARATTPGTFQTLPATAYLMYSPEVFGRTAGTTFTVTAP